jgi:hypothetical protein
MNEFSRFEEQTERLENRGRVVRMALVYTPVAAISLGFVGLALYQIVVQGEGGFVFMLVIFGFIGLLTGIQALQYLKDLTARPVEYEGEIVRKWQKGNLLIFLLPSFYLAIDSRVISGRVSRVEDGGVYVTMEGGGEGFMPKKEMVGEQESSAQEMVRPGATIKYKVLGVDGRGRYRLSARRADNGDFVTRLFSVTRVEYGMLLERDIIRVTCYPHSSTVERIERYDDVEKKFIPATDGATI